MALILPGDQLAAPAGVNLPGQVVDRAALEQAQAEAEARAAQGAAAGAPAPNEPRVNVVNADGQTFSVPQSQLERAIGQGYQVESNTQKAVREYLDENKGLKGDVKAAIRNFADEGTFGVAGAVEAATEDPLERAKRLALHEDHKIAGGIGALGGFAASMLYGGEFFKGAELAGQGTKALIRGGEKLAARELAEQAVGRSLAEAVPAGARAAAEHAGPGLARKLLAAGAGTAVEGAVLAAPRAITEAALGDPERAAETLLYGAGGGALLGLAGAGAKGIGESLALGASRLHVPAGAAVEGDALSGLRGKAKEFAEDRAFNSIASNQASLGKAFKASERIPGGKNAVGRQLLDEGLVRRVGEDPEAYAKRLSEAVSDSGNKLDQMTSALDALSPGKGQFRVSPVLDQLEEKVLPALRKRIGGEPALAKVEATISDVLRRTENGEVMSFAEARKARGEIDDLIKYSAQSLPESQEQLLKLRGVFEEQIEKQGDAAARKAGTAFADAYKAEKLRIRKLIAANEGAEDYVMREAKNRALSPTDYGAGAIGGLIGGGLHGGIAGLAASGVHHFVRKEGSGIAARALDSFAAGSGLMGVEKAMAQTAEKLDQIPAMLAGKVHPDAALRTAPAHALTDFLASMTDGAGETARTTRHGAFERVAEQLTDLASNPEQMSAKIAQLTAPYSSAAPGVAGAYAQKLATAMTYLQQNLPKPPTPRNPMVPDKWRPTDQQVQDFARRVQTVSDPFSAVARVGDASISRADVETLRAVYPKLYETIVDKVVQHASSEAPMPYAKRLKLATLLGVPLDRSTGAVPAIQSVYGSPTAAPDAGGAPHAPGPHKPMPPVKNVSTDTQRLSG